MSKGKEKPMRFEDAVAQLEAIVERIESGQIGLEECIAEYERGMKLVGRCQEVLGAVQTRIAELTADAEGKLRLKAGDAAGEGADVPDDDAREGDGDDDEASDSSPGPGDADLDGDDPSNPR